MKDQTAVMQGQLATMEKAIRVTERAYVDIENVVIDWKSAHVTLALQNTGNLPADDVAVYGQLFTYSCEDLKRPCLPKEPKNTDPYRLFLNHQKVFKGTPIYRFILNFPKMSLPEVTEIKNGQRFIQLTGHIEYTNGFHEKDETIFNFFYEAKSNQWLAAPIGTPEEWAKKVKESKR